MTRRLHRRRFAALAALLALAAGCTTVDDIRRDDVKIVPGGAAVELSSKASAILGDDSKQAYATLRERALDEAKSEPVGGADIYMRGLAVLKIVARNGDKWDPNKPGPAAKGLSGQEILIIDAGLCSRDRDLRGLVGNQIQHVPDRQLLDVVLDWLIWLRAEKPMKDQEEVRLAHEFLRRWGDHHPALTRASDAAEAELDPNWQAWRSVVFVSPGGRDQVPDEVFKKLLGWRESLIERGLPKVDESGRPVVARRRK